MKSPLLLSALLTLTAPLLPAPVQAGTVTLDNGDTLEGEIQKLTDTVVTLEHPTLGRLELDRDETTSVSLDRDDPLYDDDVDGWFFPGWDKSLEAGFSGSEGNSQTLNGFTAFNTEYEDSRHRWDVRARYFLGSDDGEQTRNEAAASVVKDWLVPGEKYFYFATLKHEYDRFTGWENRTSGFAGIGYEFIANDEHELLGRVGVGGNYEFGQVNDFTPEGLLGLEYTWSLSARATFEAYNTFFPALDPLLGEFRNVTGAAYKVKISAGRGLSLKVGIENEYNSDVVAGTEQNDFKYFGALVYDF